ncbi:AAA family ATPase [Kineococcus sp. SYSU DK003]|uniref:AAA family ATPase n=1 Tax=Kineococcus sp. SYSU DK003 TaxID=3383124 RepID=UPI003D7ED6F4
MPTAFLMVGLPASGKTTRAPALERDRGALRLTPDEWMVPLFGGENPGAGRDALEGRLLWTALRVARLGLDVVVDFGLWSREERHALRVLFAAVGADCVVEFCDVDPATQLTRAEHRWRQTPHLTFAVTAGELASWREVFVAPDAAELSGGPVPDPPPGSATWADWAAQRWPGLRP